MIRYLGRRHGGLKYERYDGPRPHTIPFPRWCISANLRSLVLSLSFLPSSSATSSPLLPLRPTVPILLPPYQPNQRRREEATCTRIPVQTVAHLGTPLSLPSNRYDPLFGGHVWCVCVRPREQAPSRVLTLGISLAIVKSFDPEEDYWQS